MKRIVVINHVPTKNGNIRSNTVNDKRQIITILPKKIERRILIYKNILIIKGLKESINGGRSLLVIATSEEEEEEEESHCTNKEDDTHRETKREIRVSVCVFTLFRFFFAASTKKPNGVIRIFLSLHSRPDLNCGGTNWFLISDFEFSFS